MRQRLIYSQNGTKNNTNHEELAEFRRFDSLGECYDNIFTYEFMSHCQVVWEGESCVCRWVVGIWSTLHENYWNIYELESMMGRCRQ